MSETQAIPKTLNLGLQKPTSIPAYTDEIDYRTKKDPVSFLSYFQRYKKGAKKVQINRGNGLIDSHAAKYLY